MSGNKYTIKYLESVLKEDIPNLQLTVKTMIKKALEIIALLVVVVGMAAITVWVMNNQKGTTTGAQDSTAVKKVLEQPPIESGQIVATVENCKLYRLKIHGLENGPGAASAYIYWSICYETDPVTGKGKAISTSITK
jgi:hypothetical protein